MKINLPSAVTSRISHRALVAQKHSPQVLFYGGIFLMGATVVSACRGTLQLEDILEEMRKDRETISDSAKSRPEVYTERDVKKLNLNVTIRGVAKIAKAYLPAITLGVAAVSCLTSAHNQLMRRNAGLSAALAATERALDSYRNRVREAYGEDKELELWRGQKTETVDDVDENGKKTGHKKKVKIGGGYSQYARVWGKDTSNEWDPQPEYNLPKLRSAQEWATMKLNSNGHIFLNEVYDMLGLERTPAGAVVGWLSKKYGGSDGYVDFGVLGREGEDQYRFLDFVTGREDCLVLDFNVDGEIWRKI